MNGVWVVDWDLAHAPERGVIEGVVDVEVAITAELRYRGCKLPSDRYVVTCRCGCRVGWDDAWLEPLWMRSADADDDSTSVPVSGAVLMRVTDWRVHSADLRELMRREHVAAVVSAERAADEPLEVAS